MSTTTPPILLRSTYPPAQPALSAQPKPFGKAPTSIGQIMFPDGLPGTHFQGSLISGAMPGVQGAAGSAVLCLTLQVDWTMGNFQLPIQFPGGSFLQSFTAVTYQPGLAGTIVDFSTQQGGSDIAAITVPAEGAVLAPVAPLVQLPLWDKACPLCPFQMWINVTGNASNTAGGTILLVNYVRLSGPWSAPAK